MNQKFDPIYHPVTKLTNLYVDAPGDRYRIGFPLNANIAADTIGKFAKSEKANHIALIHERSNRELEKYTFAELNKLARRFAAYLDHIGVKKGDPVAIHTAQSPQTAIAHMAVYKLGAVALPLSHLYGSTALAEILTQSGASIIVTNSRYWSKVREKCGSLPSLKHRIVYGEQQSGEINFEDCLTFSDKGFSEQITATEDPAIIIYTSGSTGPPKGLVHSHRIIHAYLPSLTLVYNLELNYPNAVFWSPSDWAWVGGLLDVTLPAWQHGQTVVSSHQRLTVNWAFEFMERHGVTHAFMTPTALKRLAQIPNPRERWNLLMRVVCTGGESLPSEVFHWAQEKFGIVCNEFYGLTEFTDMIGCCQKLFPSVAGSMGRAFPGHHVEIIDNYGNVQKNGTAGEIACWRPDTPTFYLGTWPTFEIPDELQLGNWLRSGDIGMKDDNGQFWYLGRTDDLIKSAGYRIGPNEVEDTLVTHPDVAEAAVVGKPDEVRGSIVTAFIRLANGIKENDETKVKLQQHVKEQLAAYKYPREIYFVDSFPLTATGKIRRDVLRKFFNSQSDLTWRNDANLR